jgi:4'-phosphopantetheinyl transferase
MHPYSVYGTSQFDSEDSSLSSQRAVGVLGANEVCIWSTSLEVSAQELLQLEALLATDEHARAARFHFSRDRRRYVVARARLRLLLACYARSAPEKIVFCYGTHGKPVLASPTADICFNVSHSQEIALFAFSRNRELGIDVERVRADLAVDELAARFFAADEVEALKALPEELRQRAFFDCWTRKESYLKALGDGITVELDTFSVSLNRGGVAALLRGSFIEQWRLMPVELGAEYAAAVCVRGANWELSYSRW